MAKRRKITRHQNSSRTDVDGPSAQGVRAQENRAPENRSDSALFSTRRGWIADGKIGLALTGLLLVYVSYYPSDSTAVEQGDSLWFSAWAIVLGMIGFLGATGFSTVGVSSSPGGGSYPGPPQPGQANSPGRRANWYRWILDVLPWMVAGWVMLAAFSTSPPGNLRMATNEAWLWVAGAAVFTAGRRLFKERSAGALLLLILIIAIGNSVHGLHQAVISLPADLAAYRADPTLALRSIGLDAPEGSALRMAFENRLENGGPTGTFALANSLAGSLVVGLVIAIGLLRSRWSSVGWLVRGALVFSSVILLGCLVATHSVSALLVSILASIATLIWVRGVPIQRANDQGAATRLAVDRRKRRNVFVVVAGFLVVGLIGIAFVSLGNPEWVDAAPTSLAFRFQYWRSTAALVIDHPWFGAGPGNFQSIYERYREASAHEQIAEPHNFLMESFGAGGLICGLGVIGLTGLISFRAARHLAVLQDRSSDAPAESATGATATGMGQASSAAGGKAILIGGLGGLAIVWLGGMVLGRLPDIEAQVIAIPIALIVAVCIAPLSGSMATSLPLPRTRRVAESISHQQIGMVAVAALLVHLSVSGGWTVPGLAMLVWCLAAAIVPAPTEEDESLVEGQSVGGQSRPFELNARSGMTLAIGLLLLVGIRFMSIGPVTSATRLIDLAGYQQSQGRLGQAGRLLDEAIESDSWSVFAALSRADLAHWELIGRSQTSTPSAQLYGQWSELVDLVKRRAGDDPAIYRALLQQVLHVYQRFGRPQDLADSEQMLIQTTIWSPSHQWHWAQLAAVQQEMGDLATATESAERAERLSRLTTADWENYQRWLERQLIVVPRFIGSSVATAPQLEPASSLLANLLSGNDVVQDSGG